MTRLRDRIAEHEDAKTKAEEVSKTLGTENLELRQILQDLRSYVDGRRPEWARLKLKLGHQKKTVQGLKAGLAAKENLIERHGIERAALRGKINELETRCDTLAAERDATAGEKLELSARAEENSAALEDAEKNQLDLSAALEQQEAHVQELVDELRLRHEEVSALRAELADYVQAQRKEREARADAEKRAVDFETQLSERVNVVRSLEEDLACRHGEIESLHRELMRVQKRLDEATEDLATRDARIEELAKARTGDLRALESTRAELVATAEQRDALGQELACRERQIGELQSQAEQLEIERERLSQDLGKQAEVSKDLEHALHRKRQSINLLSRRVDRLASIEANVRKLDERMSNRTSSRQAELPADVTRLIVTRRGAGTVKYPISKDTVTIGRAADSDIQIVRQYISRHHARILSDPDGTVIEDLNSKNGILVNAQRVQRQRLRSGDTVDIGKVQFRFIDLLEERAGERKA